MHAPPTAPQPQLTGFAMPLQDAVTGAGVLGLKGGPLPRPVPLVTVVGAPLRLPPFSGEAARPGRASASLHGGAAFTAVGMPSPHRSPAAPCRPPHARAGDLRSDEGRAHVDACHARYCEALQALYDAHKDRYAPGRLQEMRFVE